MTDRRLADATQLQGASKRGGGNRVYLFPGDGDASGEARILKIYRRRRQAWRAPFRGFGNYMEGKRGTDADARYETERLSLALWARHGFDVPALIAAPLPIDVPAPALWMAYCPGETLSRSIHRRDRETAPVADAIARYAASTARRHRVAEAEQEPLLVPEHPEFGHVIVSGERLVTFDLEGGFRPGYPVATAIGFEIAGLARTLLRAKPDDLAALLDAFAAGYGEQLGPRVRAALSGRGLRAWSTRTRGRLRSRFLGKKTKDAALRALDARIS